MEAIEGTGSDADDVTGCVTGCVSGDKAGGGNGLCIQGGLSDGVATGYGNCPLLICFLHRARRLLNHTCTRASDKPVRCAISSRV